MSSAQQKFTEAVQLHQSGDLNGAVQLYRAVLADNPRHADAAHMLGIIAQQRGDTNLALKLTETALALKPDLALAWYNRSLLLRALGRGDDALYSVRQALRHDAGLPDAWDMAGSLLREAGACDEAAQHHAEAMKLNPHQPRYNSNYAIALMAQGDLTGAYQAVRANEKLDKDSPSFVLGNVLRAAGYSEKAIPHYQRVSRLAADMPEALMNEAMAWLQIGDMERAWPIWQTLPDHAKALQDVPRWRGEKTGHLLLHEEQGMGDALQCLRYIDLIRDRAAAITLQLNKALQRLVQFNFPDLKVLTLEDGVPPVEAHAQLMDLPALLNTNLQTIPSRIPYLRADEAWRTPWAERLKKVKPTRVGFVWGGNPNHRNNRNRSLELRQCMPLFEAAAGHGVSLQKWTGKDQAGLAAAALCDADPHLHDFADTAGLMMDLDLIVTVDTSVAHLAGALGRPAWVLIPFDPDWRWMIGREDSPWYPTLKLYRQTVPGDWQTALKPMARDLRKFIDGDLTVLKAEIWTSPPLRQNPFALKLEDLS